MATDYHKYPCSGDCDCGCGECQPWNCLEHQVNGILSTKEGQLQGYVDEAKDAAAESKASAEASAQSAVESKEYRDEAEIAASTAVAAEGVVLGVANTLQDTADKLEQITDELNTAVAGIAVATWYYTTVSENQTVIPVPEDKNEVSIQSIYIEGSRQEPNRGFVFDKLARTITLAEGLPLGIEIAIIMGTYSDNPNDFSNTLASPTGASLIGTSDGKTVQESLNLLNGLITPITWNGFAGGANNTGTAVSDAAFSAANATGRSIFVPAGTYKISGNTDMSDCELMFEKGATIDIQAGATLTVGRILCGLHQVFSGAGNVVFTTNTIKAHPEWFGAARGIDSTPALTKCQAACSPNKITIDLVDEYFISDLVWDRRVPAKASPRSAFKPFGSAANGVKLTAGNSVGKNSFPAISGFPGYGMRIVGTSLANIYISEIQGCGDALILETSGSATTLLDTEVTLTSISACDNAVVFVADKLANVMQGNKVYVNFIANCTNSVLFRDNGLASPGPNWDSNQVITQAIDPTPNRPDAVMLNNACGYAINRFVFRVETWAGGMASTGKFINGRFNDLDAYINLAQNPGIGQLAYVGASNRVDFSSARGRNVTPVTASRTPNSLASFNGGVPLFHNVVKLQITFDSSDWPNNDTRQVYVYHQLTDQNTNAFTVMPPDTGAFRGCIVDSIIDNSQTNPYEIIINLRNVSGSTITAGSTNSVVNFKLRVGLY